MDGLLTVNLPAPDTAPGPPRSGASATPEELAFGDLLAARVAQRESQLVAGLDPDPAALWPAAARPPRPGDAGPSVAGGAVSDPLGTTACAVADHCRALIDAVAPACLGVKLQLACFERLQAPGWRVASMVVEHAHAHGLLVIADGKRGDIPTTAAVYAQALFGAPPPARTDRESAEESVVGTPGEAAGAARGLGADLATVNPLLGRESVEPFLTAARPRGAAVLALVRTSNPGAADIQDLPLADGGTVWEKLARMVDDLGRQGVGGSGLSDVGAVVGATAPWHLERARQLMPHAVILLPGIGAQGARVEDLAAAFMPAPAAGPRPGGPEASGRRASALITAARSIAGAYLVSGQQPAHAARAEAERLRAAAWHVC